MAEGERLVGLVTDLDLVVRVLAERAVGDALEDISESDSSTDVSDDPPRGTPDRVQRARKQG